MVDRYYKRPGTPGCLREENPGLQLLLITTYPWDPNDPIAEHIRYAKRLTTGFVDGVITGDAKAARDSWWEHIGSPEEDPFRQFLGSMQFRTGYPATAELIDWTAERMEYQGLRCERNDVLDGGRQIYEWIVAGKDTITQEDMLAAIEARSLRNPEATLEPSVALSLHTILKEPLESDGDWELDWRDYFEGQEWLRGHRVHDPAVWNEVMLPEIVKTRESIASDTSCRLLRVRGKARLSAWFAIGWVFSRVAGWTIEVDQNGQRWRNDATPSPDLTLIDQLEERGGEKGVLAVGLSITGDLSSEVRAYLKDAGEPADKLLLVQTNLGLGVTAMRSDGDVTALAQLSRDQIRTVLGERPKRVLLFYFGPLSGAAFIGAQLNAVAEEIQVYEDQLPGYAPSFRFGIG
jgi:hypothetical protein